jgi:hypothetical protein
MSAWRTPVDLSVNLPCHRTIGEAIEESINEIKMGRDNDTETLMRQVDQIARVLKIVCDLVLTDEQEQTVGRSLGFKEAP